jgi:hypothetical protein
MPSMHRLIPAALLTAAAVSAHAASLDCQRASAPRERAVCQSAELSRYDRQLAALYQAARRKLSVAALASVQTDQNYSPNTVHDALSAILNQITGESFEFVYNGATPQQRASNQKQWQAWCQKTFPGKSAICLSSAQSKAE